MKKKRSMLKKKAKEKSKRKEKKNLSVCVCAFLAPICVSQNIFFCGTDLMTIRSYLVWSSLYMSIVFTPFTI